MIGANFDDVGAAVNQGSAYVFTRSGNKWTPPFLQFLIADADMRPGAAAGSRTDPDPTDLDLVVLNWHEELKRLVPVD